MRILTILLCLVMLASCATLMETPDAAPASAPDATGEAAAQVDFADWLQEALDNLSRFADRVAREATEYFDEARKELERLMPRLQGAADDAGERLAEFGESAQREAERLAQSARELLGG